LGLTHTFAPVGRPTGNAVVERVIRTMKEEVVWLQDWEDAAQLRVALVAWQRRYNETRPHQALDWLTPAEYRAKRLGAPTREAALYRTRFPGHQSRFARTPPIRDARRTNMSRARRPGR
jgi:hypothetical protein